MYGQLLKAIGKECAVVLDGAEKLRNAKGGGKSKEDRLEFGLRNVGLDGSVEREEGEEDGEAFEFFGNVVWKEVGERLMDELGGMLFAAGRPNELHLVSFEGLLLSLSQRRCLSDVHSGFFK